MGHNPPAPAARWVQINVASSRRISESESANQAQQQADRTLRGTITLQPAPGSCAGTEYDYVPRPILRWLSLLEEKFIPEVLWSVADKKKKPNPAIRLQPVKGALSTCNNFVLSTKVRDVEK